MAEDIQISSPRYENVARLSHIPVLVVINNIKCTRARAYGKRYKRRIWKDIIVIGTALSALNRQQRKITLELMKNFQK